MLNVFYNAEERRLRAGWRLILQFLLFVVVIGISMVLSGQNPQDPAFAAALGNSQWVRLLSGFGSMAGILVSFFVASRWLDRRPLADFGFHFNKNWWADFGFGLFLGAILMVFIFLVELAAGWVTVSGTMVSLSTSADFWTGMLTSLVMFIFVGIYEEMLSRGYQMRNIAEGLNFGPINAKTALLIGYLLSSSVFGLLHMFNSHASVISTVNLIVAGLFLGFGYLLTGELAIPIGLHMTWNFFQGNVFGFPVSGGRPPATLIAIQQGGPDLWTGGAFGPEAGLIGLIAIAIGCGLTVLWVKVRYGRVAIQESLAVYAPANKPGKIAAAEAQERALPTAG